MLKKTTIQHLIVTLFALSSHAQAAEQVINARGVVIHDKDQYKVAVEDIVQNDDEQNLRGITVQNVVGDDVLIIDGDQLDFEVDRNLHASGRRR